MSAIASTGAAVVTQGLARGGGALAAVAVASLFGLAIPTLDDLVARLSGFPALIVLPLIAVTGETVILAAVIVATQGDWSLTEVVLWCFVGTVASDALWFRLAGVVDTRWLQRRGASDRHRRTVAWLRRRTGERPHLALLFIKFLYGSRFLMLVYLATRRLPLRRFLVFDGMGTAVWLAVLVPVGWLLGHGLMTAAAAGRLDLAIVGVIVALLVTRGLFVWNRERKARRSLPSSPPMTRNTDSAACSPP
jgi:membrane-associated protein